MNDVLKNIPYNRLIAYLVVIGLLPALFSMLHYMSNRSYVNGLINQIEIVKEMAQIKEGKQSVNKQVKATFRNSDHFYIDKNLETLDFLSEEIGHLSKLTPLQKIGRADLINKRIEFLSGTENILAFNEGAVKDYGTFQETLEVLAKPVEVSTDDLKNLLVRIEGVPIGSNHAPEGRPQLIITDFRIERKPTLGENESYLLNLKFIKRELKQDS
jgi:hypothetical protein